MTLIREAEELIDSLKKKSGVALILGDAGCGKTTLCENIIDSLTLKKIKCAYIDANIANNTLSGLGIIGMTICTYPEPIKQKNPQYEYFVGSMTTIGHGIDIIFGISKLIRKAKKEGCKVILVDTMGEYDFTQSVIFTQNEIESLYPDYIVGIQASHEIEFAICPFLKRNNINIALLEKNPLAQNKQNLLEFGKKMSFNKLFKNSQSHIVMMSEVAFLNTWLGNGRQLKWQYMRTISNILKSEVFHVEIAYKTLFIFSNAILDDIMLNDIKSYLHVSHVVVQPPNVYTNLYVGLRDEESNHLGVGLIENIFFNKNTMMIRSNILTTEPIKEIKFGFIKSTPTGDFITKI